MGTNLGDSLSGLLLLGSDSNNDSDDGSTTCITNDSNVTPTSSNGGLTPTSNAGGMDAAPTPPAAETKKRKYKKRGSTSFKQHKGTKVSRGSSKTTHAAKQSASAAILASLNDTFENEEDAFENNGSENVDDAIENESVMLCEEDVRKLIHLFYIKVVTEQRACWAREGWCGLGHLGRALLHPRAGRLRIPSCSPPPLRGAITLAAEEEEGDNNGIQGVGGGRRVSW
jgi:hypothetical protein